MSRNAHCFSHAMRIVTSFEKHCFQSTHTAFAYPFVEMFPRESKMVHPRRFILEHHAMHIIKLELIHFFVFYIRVKILLSRIYFLYKRR